MFCPKCGQELTPQARFCTRCGADLQNLVQQSAPAPEPPKVETSTSAPGGSRSEPVKAESEMQKASVPEEKRPESSFDSCDGDRWAAAVGKNQAYYLPEFQKIQSGEKSRFNWAAFLLGPALCFYRKCGNFFKRYYLIPLLLMLTAYLVVTIGTITFNLILISGGGIIELIGGIWGFINSIRLGKRFNQLYFERCSLNQGASNKSGTSVKAACLFYAAVIAISLIINLGGGAVARMYYSSLSDADSDSGYMDQWNDGNFSDSDSPEENYAEDYQADNPQSDSLTPANIPTTSQIIEYTDFVGEFDNIEPAYGGLDISWEDFTLCIDLYEYDYSGSVLADNALTGNSFIFEANDPYNRVSQSIKLTYVPAADSPYGADTIYAEFLEPMNKMEIFMRSPGSSYFDPYEASEPMDTSGIPYSEYNLYLFEGTYTDAGESIDITLTVLPDETGFECELFWRYGKLWEQGEVSPGLRSLLSEGTIVTIDLDPSLNIHVLLEGDDLGADYYEMDMFKA